MMQMSFYDPLTDTGRDGMVFNATITAPTINGAGEVNFLQTVVAQRDRSGSGYPDQKKNSDEVPVLDFSVPYGYPGRDDPPTTIYEWPIKAGETLTYVPAPNDPNDNPLTTIDSPWEELILNPWVENPMTGIEEKREYSTYSTNDSFTMYLIYKPNGKDSIWVPLRGLSWEWIATAEWKLDTKDNTMKWMITSEASCCDNYDWVVTALPEWSENVTSVVDAGYVDKKQKI
jgi:hypothetical protein